MNNARKNKSLLINPKFQLTVVGLFAALSLCACTALYFTIHYIFGELVGKGVALGLAPGHTYYQFIDWQKSRFDLAFLVVAAAVFIGTMALGLVLSHRIAGPLHRFIEYLEELKHNPEAGPMKFREGDFFPELPECFNEYQAFKVQEQKKDKAS